MDNPETIIVPLWLLGNVLAVIGLAFGFWLQVIRPRAKEPIPGWNARMKNCPYLPEDIAQALNAFISEYGDAFGEADADRLRKMINRKRLFGLLRFSISFRRVHGKRYYILKHTSGDLLAAGHMASARSIVVAHLPEDPLGAIAFFHELLHPSLLLLHGASDNNHAKPPGPWTDSHDALIRRLKKRFSQTFAPSLASPSIDHLEVLNHVPDTEESAPVICGTCASDSSDFE